MPQVRYCTECDNEVELDEEGHCPMGHSLESVGGLRERTDREESPRSDSLEKPVDRKPRAWLWVGAAAIATLAVAAVATDRVGSPLPTSQLAPPQAPREPSAELQQPQSDVQNASFEDWSGAVPVGWSLSSTAADGAATQRSDWTHSGAHGVGLVNASVEDAETTRLWQAIRIVAGQPCRARVWVITDRRPSCAQLSIRFVDSSGKTLSESVTTGEKTGVESAGMRQLSVTGTAPEGTASAEVALVLAGGKHVNGANAPSSAVFDDLIFEASRQ